MKRYKKHIVLSALFIIAATVFVSVGRFDNTCDELRDNILRLHILADDDTDVAQSVKLKVRDAVSTECNEIFSECSSLYEAESKAKNNILRIEKAANDILESNGCDYKATVSLTTEKFSTRIYDKFTLPAGTYKSLTVKLGDAKGKNWWCIVYPNVCLSASGDLKGVVNDSAREISETQDKYIVKFWIVELYEKICGLFEKK